MSPTPTAAHAAAHAVANVLLLPEFAAPSVTIVPDTRNGREILGRCNGPSISDCIADNTRRETARLVRALAVAKFAGPIAEARVDPDYDGDGDEQDVYSALYAVHHYTRSRGKLVKADARRFCRRNWTTILAVAELLDARQTLTGEEVAALVASHQGGSRPFSTGW